MLSRRHGSLRKELNVKTPFNAIEKWYQLKPELFKKFLWILKLNYLLSNNIIIHGFLNNVVKLDNNINYTNLIVRQKCKLLA
jgi:hypothetical protein